MRTFRQHLSHVALVPRAALELTCARIRLIRLKPQDILRLNSLPFIEERARLCEPDKLKSKMTKILYVLPRVAARIPWRSDCLIQALAAQHWLSKYGILTKVEIGVQKDQTTGFRAHAWVLLDGLPILGGEVSDFTPLFSQA